MPLIIASVPGRTICTWLEHLVNELTDPTPRRVEDVQYRASRLRKPELDRRVRIERVWHIRRQERALPTVRPDCDARWFIRSRERIESLAAFTVGMKRPQPSGDPITQ